MGNFRTAGKLLSILGLSSVVLAGCASIDMDKLINNSPPTSSEADAHTSPSFDPAKIAKVAVFVEEPREFRSLRPAMRTVEDNFIGALMAKGYAIASRSDMDVIMKEMHFQNAGMTDVDAAKLGKMLNVSAVLVVSATDYQVSRVNTPSYQRLLVEKMSNLRPDTEYETRASIGARLISVQQGEILWVGRYSAKGVSTNQQGEGAEMSAYASRIVANALPAR